MEKIISKHMEPPWEQRWQSPLPIFSLADRVETEIMSQSTIKPLVWKRYIDDIFSLWNTNSGEITQFIEQANKHHPTIKFTAEVSDTEITFLDTIIYKGVFFETKSEFDVRTHFKPTDKPPQKRIKKIKESCRL